MKKSKEKYLPLDQFEVTTLNLKTDNLEQRPALHYDLCQQRLSGNLYRKVPPIIQGSQQQWFEMLDAVSTDLQWLLSLVYEKFWCQVINDQSVHVCLDSYLRFAPRYRQSAWPEELVKKHNHLHKLVFMVFLRMSTLKESPKHFMTEDLFSRIIYDHFLFDIPRMMDVCSLYGVPDNIPLLKKMMENIFHHQPHYYEDLKEACKTVVQIIEQIEQKCLASCSENETPNRLTSGPPKAPLFDMSEQEFKDIVLYIHDVLRTIQLFTIDVFSEAAHSFYEIGIVGKLQKMYSEMLPSIRSELRDRQSSLHLHTYHELRTHVRQSRESLLKIVGGMIKSCAYEPVMNAIEENDQEKVEDLAEEYFDVLTSLLTDQRFFEEFKKKFDIRQDVKNLSQACPQVGETQAQFLFQAMGDPPEHEDPSLTISNDTLFNGTQDESSLASSSSLTNQVNQQSLLSGSNDAETASLVSSVRDILPDLSVEFVNSCIRYFDFNPEKVVQAILEDNLPPHLQSISRSSDEVALESVDKSKNSESTDQPSTSGLTDYLKDRQNIYDNDEFDVFGQHSHVDQSMVHYGKRDKSDVAHWSIGNDTDAEKLRELYSRYGLGTEIADDDGYLLKDNLPSNYDDEYDDTYDDVAVGANDADSADELMEKKKKESSEESEEEVVESTPRDPRHFLENPEILRAKEEARRRQREGDSTSRGGRGKRFTRHNPSEKRPSTHKYPPRRYQDYIPRDRKPKDTPTEQTTQGSSSSEKPVENNVPNVDNIHQRDSLPAQGQQNDSSKSSNDKNNEKRKGDKTKPGAGHHHKKVWSGKKGGGGFKGR